MAEKIRIPKKIQKVIGEVGDDNSHGATWLSRRSLEIMAEAAGVRGVPKSGEELADYLREIARLLRESQPTMSSLSNHLVRAMSRMPGFRSRKPGFGQLDRDAVEQAVKEELDSQQKELDDLGLYGAELLAEKFPGKARLLTLSHSDAVLEIFKRLAGGDELQITVAESRPVCEGVELARQLGKLGFNVRLVPDAMLGIETVSADCILTGADTVYADGSVVNKAGTRLLALAAKMDKVPYFCCTQTIKISPSIEKNHGPMVPSQRRRDPNEVLEKAPKGVTVRNLYFDRTEYFLVSGFISETGFLRVKEIAGLSEQMARLEQQVFNGG